MMTVPHLASLPLRMILLRRGQEGQRRETGRSQRKEEREAQAAVLMPRDPGPGRGGKRRRNTSLSQNIRNPKNLRNLKRNPDTPLLRQKKS